MKLSRNILVIGIWTVLCVGCTSVHKQQSNEATPPESREPDSVGYIVKVGDAAPDFSLTLHDGNAFTLSDQRGKVVMLQFTASWCGVCRKEMPRIEQDIWQRHKQDPDFVLVGIDREEPLETVLKFREDVGVTYPLGLDADAAAFCKYADTEAGITRNVLIDRDGYIVKLTRLYDETEFASLAKMIDEMLND